MQEPKPDHQHQDLDSGIALQRFLDRIPIGSVPGIKSSPVVELKTGDSVKNAIHLLYEEDVSGAPIADAADPDSKTTSSEFSDRYMGCIDFARMVLWSLAECEKDCVKSEGNSGEKSSQSSSIFTMLEENPRVGETKVGELAKSFLWDPFFPVHLDDTLFHVLLLLSKHQLQFVPVMERTNFRVTGFVTQVLQYHWTAFLILLIECSSPAPTSAKRQDCFDSVADKAISELSLESDGSIELVYEDWSLAEAMHILWESRIGAVAVVKRRTKRVIGCMRNSDIHLLLQNNELFNGRKSIKVDEFIQTDSAKVDSDPTIDRDLTAPVSAGIPCLRNGFLRRMNSPVTCRRSNTLKQAMRILAETKSSFSFLVDDSMQLTGVLTLRDIIIQFAPPGVDSSIQGGGFFESALEQTGCQVKNGTIICDH